MFEPGTKAATEEKDDKLEVQKGATVKTHASINFPGNTL